MKCRTPSTLHHGKKLGQLEVPLDRKKMRYRHATVTVELRFEIGSGTFYAQWDGTWFASTTKDGLAAQIKEAATKALNLEWKRYLRLYYTAEGSPFEDPRSRRPRLNGLVKCYDLDDDRAKGVDDLGGKHEACTITSLELKWTVCQISEPYTLPEDSTRRVRAERAIHVYQDASGIKEILSDPEEWETDLLPKGTFLWTPARETFLVEVLTALGQLDRRLLALFSGDATQLASKIDDARLDPSRVLAPSSPSPSPPSPMRASSRSRQRPA